MNRGYIFEGDYHMTKAYNLSKKLLAMGGQTDGSIDLQ